MIIVWSRNGWLVGVLGIACFFGTQLATDGLFDDPKYYETHAWAKLAACALAAGLTWLLSHHEAGMEGHFFFIPIKYWVYIYIALGLVLAFH